MVRKNHLALGYLLSLFQVFLSSPAKYFSFRMKCLAVPAYLKSSKLFDNESQEHISPQSSLLNLLNSIYKWGRSFEDFLRFAWSRISCFLRYWKKNTTIIHVLVNLS